jgi:AcrR family transcriptional regulator
MPPVPRPARPAVREKVLDAARTEFARRGLEHARVEDIARRAGISKGAFYLHFRTKDDAFRELVQRLVGALEDHALRRREQEERIARARGAAEARREAERALATELLELLWRHRSVLAALEGAGDGGARELATAVRRRIQALVSRSLVERKRAGALRADVDPTALAEIVAGAYEVLARRMFELRRRPDLAGWARSLLLVLDEGMLAPSVRVRRAPRFAADRRGH